MLADAKPMREYRYVRHERNAPAATLLTLCVALACRVGEAPAPEPGPEPAVEEPVAVDEPSHAALLLEEARTAFEVADAERALSLAEEVLERYPDGDEATPALWVAARAAYSLGLYERAAEYAEAYASLLPETAPEGRDALKLAFVARDAAAPPQGPAPIIGAILPRSGSPVMRRYGDWVLEGIELAVREHEERMGREVDLVVLDDSASPGKAVELTWELERRGAAAIIGPLLDLGLAAAARARVDEDLVIISPTAAERPADVRNAFALNAGDTRGAQSLATAAWDLGFDRAAVVYPSLDPYRRKAQAFEVEFEALGGDIVATAAYDSGTTTFETPLRRVQHAASPPVDTMRPFLTVVDTFPGQHDALWAELIAAREAADTLTTDTAIADTSALLAFLFGFARDTADVRDPFQPIEPLPPPLPVPPDTVVPDSLVDDTVIYRMAPWALFVPAPPRDVRQIAPQVEFYGLDSAGVQVFGDASWTSPEVLRLVDRRALERVVASSPLDPAEADRGVTADFVERYETAYRRTLNNPLPALGYDAATLVLASLPNRGVTPRAVARRFSFIEGIRGATGVFSVYGNDIVRAPYMVVIRGGRLLPAPTPFEYVMPIAKPPIPPEPDTTELVEEKPPPLPPEPGP